MLKAVLKYFFLLLFLPLFCSAQQAETIRGIVFKQSMLIKLADVSITNLTTNVTTKSNFYGEFITRASIGDTILIEKATFTPIKQAITSYSTLYITLLPNITLNEVSIKGQTKKQELNEVMNTYRSKGLYYDGKPPALAYVFNPLTTFHELFGSTGKQSRAFAKFAKGEMEATEINKRYTPDLVSKTTGLTGIDIQHFMDNYTPAHDDLVKWNDYELIQYIKKSYESYKKVGYQPPVDIFKSGPSK